MIETAAQREKRIKAEAKDRADRAARYAKWEAEQKGSPNPPAGKLTEQQKEDAERSHVNPWDKALTPLTAKTLIKQINDKGTELAELILRAHRLEIWKTLGLASWSEFVTTHLTIKRAHAYRLLDHAETLEHLSPTGDSSEEKPQERQTRPMKNLTPPEKRKAWKKATKAAGGAQPTAKQVTAAVNAIKPAKVTEISTQPNLAMHPTVTEPNLTPNGRDDDPRTQNPEGWDDVVKTQIDTLTAELAAANARLAWIAEHGSFNRDYINVEFNVPATSDDLNTAIDAQIARETAGQQNGNSR